MQPVLRDPKQQKVAIQQRFSVLYVLVALFGMVLWCRLFDLQVHQASRFKTLSVNNIIRIQPIAPRRGLILDRQGAILAQNQSRYFLKWLPGGHSREENTKHLQQVAKFFHLPDKLVSQALLDAKVAPRVPMVLKADLSEQEVADFYAHAFLWPGFWVNSESVRDYPQSTRLAHLLGFLRRVPVPEKAYPTHLPPVKSSGLEAQLSPWLEGTVGQRIAEVNAKGALVRARIDKPSIAGSDVYLTIDGHLQQVLESALTPYVGAAVVIDPRNGELLAMASHPTFDPNVLSWGQDRSSFEQLWTQSDQPLFHRAIAAQYPPGSTIKPFIAAGALAVGRLDPKIQIKDPGWFRLNDHSLTYHDWLPQGHGWVNLRRAIAVSCDTYFYQLAVNLGINTIDSILSVFGFGLPAPLPLPGQRLGVLPSPDWKRKHQHHRWVMGDTVNAGIGQGFMLVTPLQLAYATAILANRGAGVPLHLIQSIRSPLGEVSDWQPETIHSMLNWPEKSFGPVIAAMEDVVHSPEGTGGRFGKPFYAVAAKTGTSQVFSKHHYHFSRGLPYALRDHSTFIAFSPVEHPRIAVAVVLEHDPNAPKIARQVLDAYWRDRNHG